MTKYIRKQEGWESNMEDYLDKTGYETYVNRMPPSELKYKMWKKIRTKKIANKILEHKGIDDAMITLCDRDHTKYCVRPSSHFYKDNPECFGWGVWSSTEYEKGRDAIDSVLEGNLPNIEKINYGWERYASESTVNKCNNIWHTEVEKDLPLDIT